MRVGIATDHGGFRLKQELVAHLRAAGHEIVDFRGAQLDPNDDYPDFVVLLARAVVAGTVECGCRDLRKRRRRVGLRQQGPGDSAPRSSTTTSRRSRAWRTTT